MASESSDTQNPGAAVSNGPRTHWGNDVGMEGSGALQEDVNNVALFLEHVVLRAVREIRLTFMIYLRFIVVFLSIVCFIRSNFLTLIFF